MHLFIIIKLRKKNIIINCYFWIWKLSKKDYCSDLYTWGSAIKYYRQFSPKVLKITAIFFRVTCLDLWFKRNDTI